VCTISASLPVHACLSQATPVAQTLAPHPRAVSCPPPRLLSTCHSKHSFVLDAHAASPASSVRHQHGNPQGCNHHGCMVLACLHTSSTRQAGMRQSSWVVPHFSRCHPEWPGHAPTSRRTGGEGNTPPGGQEWPRRSSRPTRCRVAWCSAWRWRSASSSPAWRAAWQQASTG
jgi:hypothetical protein